MNTDNKKINSDNASLAAQAEYREWLSVIKNRIKSSQFNVALSANRELIHFYWDLGRMIVKKQKMSKWGDKIISQLSLDLRKEFTSIQGLSVSNLKYCKRFFLFYSIGQQGVDQLEDSWEQVIQKYCVDQIPWSHNIHIFTKSKTLESAKFYIAKTIENSWGRDTLALQIKSNLFKRQGNAVTNFSDTLPVPHSDLAQQTLKDPYIFDFLTMTQPYNELEIELKLVKHITRFLLELGKGFAFIGRQYPLEVDGNSYYIDLLFYHTKLKCYVVVELKNKKFIPEFAGKLNFYLSAVDSLVKADDDNPTIGLLLCRDKSNIEVEFALRDMKKAIGVSEYIMTEALPDNLKGSIPTVEEIEADLNLIDND